MTAYSNRALAETLGWRAELRAEHERKPLDWVLEDPSGEPTTSNRHYTHDYAWTDCPRFDSDPAAMIALMERLREMGYGFTLVRGIIGTTKYGCHLWSNPNIIDWRSASHEADTPMEAMAHAVWKALESEP